MSLMYLYEHFALLFISPAVGELFLWGQIPCVSRVTDHLGLKRLWTPQPVPLAGRKVCMRRSQVDESPWIF